MTKIYANSSPTCDAFVWLMWLNVTKSGHKAASLAKNKANGCELLTVMKAEMVYFGLHTYLICELLLEVNNLIKKHIGDEKGPSKEKKIEFGSWIK